MIFPRNSTIPKPSPQ